MTRKVRDRRSVLLSGLALGAAAKIGLADSPACAATNGAAAITVVVSLDGKSYEFDETKGRDLGDYKGPGFVQRCIMVTVPDLPLSVFIRPDCDSERMEAYLSRPHVERTSPPSWRLHGRDRTGRQVDRQNRVPKHFWFSRWRWQSAPRPAIGKTKELIAAGLLPPYTEGAGRAAAPPPREYTIMGLAGLEPGMPTTGDRDDIGPVTEPQARWICTGARDALATMIAQAEASGTFPWNMRDEKTGAPFNFDQYPKGGWFSDAPNMSNPFIPSLRTNMVVDWAHHPALAYVPFLATGDPHYLERCSYRRPGASATSSRGTASTTSASCLMARHEGCPAPP